MALKDIYHGVLSQEAIAYQAKSTFFHDLTFALQKFIDGGKYNQAALDATGIEAMILKHTGLKVELGLIPGEINAYAIPPILDPNTPLLDRWRQYGYNDVEDYGDYILGYKKVSSFAKELRGSIDLGNARVTGVFSQLLSTVKIGTGLWMNAKCSAEEVAGILLHELGHVFTFMESLMQTATMNMALAAATQALAKTDQMEHRLELVFETEKTLGVKVEDAKALAAKNVNAKTYQAVFIKATMDARLRSAAGSSTYDLRSSEFIADQFAARYGAGRYMVTGLDRMYRAIGYNTRVPTWAHYVMQALTMAGLLVAAINMPVHIGVFMVVMLGFVNFEGRVYDDPGERAARIKQDLVQSLKNPALKPDQRQRLLDDIEAIDAIRDGMKDHRSWLNYLWIACTSHRREQYGQMRFQQEIEKLVNNDFFVHASKLKNFT